MICYRKFLVSVICLQALQKPEFNGWVLAKIYVIQLCAKARKISEFEKHNAVKNCLQALTNQLGNIRVRTELSAVCTVHRLRFRIWELKIGFSF